MLRAFIITLGLNILFSGYAHASIHQDFLRDVQKYILIEDSKNAQANLIELKELILAQKNNPTEERANVIKDKFKALVLNWKKVEAVYVAGGVDEDYLDHPRFIDYFNQGNESIHWLVSRAIAGNQDLQNALFKNSTKSINALEYLLFNIDHKKDSSRYLDAAVISINHIGTWLEEIVDFYQSDKKFVEQDKQSVSLLVNRLIDSSYKLRTWRVGEAGGFVKKYEGSPSADRLEYPLSSISLEAIISILDTHIKVIENKNTVDLLAIGKQSGAQAEIALILEKALAAKKAARALQSPLKTQIKRAEYKTLFTKLDELHNAYYFMLIDALGLKSQIIDADGD